MKWLLELSDLQWDRLDDLIGATTTVVVAGLVAWLALRKDSSLQKSERHFQFRDERAEFYSEFIEKMNSAFALYWDCIETDENPDHPARKEAQKTALAVDTQAYKIQIRAPNFVSHACRNMNGHTQHLITMLLLKGEVGAVPSSEYEKAKDNMLRAM